MAEPRHADAPTDAVRGHTRPECVNDADNLMTGHDRQARIRQLAIHDVQVRATDATGLDAQANLARAGLRIRPVFWDEWPAWSGKDHRLHGLLPPPS
jgi:hypothetical protein